VRLRFEPGLKCRCRKRVVLMPVSASLIRGAATRFRRAKGTRTTWCRSASSATR
jgi:hypothetical protein